MITVLMSVYNARPDELRRAIESILRQSWADFEFLILDDGSTDSATIKELATLAAADRRIRLELEPHRGLTRTLNRGLGLARGEWIARQDADDWSDPDRLQCQMRRATEPGQGEEITACGTNAWMHRQDGRPLWPTRLPEDAMSVRHAFYEGNPMVHGSVLFRADVARQIGGYREAFPCSQDYDFFWRLSESGPVVNLVAPLYHYCFTASSVSSSRAREQAQVHWAAQFLAHRRRNREPEDVPEALRLAGHSLQSPAAQAGSVLPAGSGAGSITGAADITGAAEGMGATDRCLRAALKQADHRLLAGDFRGAFAEYLRLLRGHPSSLLSWGKVARWAIFTACPPMRRSCF